MFNYVNSVHSRSNYGCFNHTRGVMDSTIKFHERQRNEIWVSSLSDT